MLLTGKKGDDRHREITAYMTYLDSRCRAGHAITIGWSGRDRKAVKKTAYIEFPILSEARGKIGSYRNR
ncbi:MAG: hypothetical protein PPHEMADM_4785 [uncultured Paraburkholderia sp.]|nr:MAG: hypothetical protein PPHEMADE_4778 [uncultured Paraburkholderia sp.]CAH2940206.1 MAG: hypothetical protein PPHEMADM_4785 [uncultured Paraburkholderia sp.]